MNATVFAAYKHKPSMMNRHYSLSMWSSLTDGPTNSVALALLVLLVILVLLSTRVGHFFVNNPLTVSKWTHSKRREYELSWTTRTLPGFCHGFSQSRLKAPGAKFELFLQKKVHKFHDRIQKLIEQMISIPLQLQTAKSTHFGLSDRLGGISPPSPPPPLCPTSSNEVIWNACWHVAKSNCGCCAVSFGVLFCTFSLQRC